MRDRTAERREQLLRVGEELLGSNGAAAVTMRAVCRVAELSPRYFYESFASREDLLTAVYNRAEERWLAHLFGAQLSDETATLRSVLEICADYFASDPRQARILLREPLADDTLRKHSASRTPAVIIALLPLLGAEARQITPRGGDELALLSSALWGVLLTLYTDWADGRLAVGREKFADAAVNAVLALTRASHGGSMTAG